VGGCCESGNKPIGSVKGREKESPYSINLGT